MIRKSIGLAGALMTVAALVALPGCSGDDGKAGAAGVDGEPCSVEEGKDGAVTITCPDGSEVTIEGGAKGAKGPKGADGADGADGQDGADGADGQDGADGAPGGSCSVECVDATTGRIFCDDGTEILVPGAQCDDGSGPGAGGAGGMGGSN